VDVTLLDVSRRVRPALVVTRWVLALVLVALVCGSVALALRESAPAGSIRGVLVSVDHRDGGDSGTGLVTVQYLDGTGHLATAQVVMTLSGWPSLNPGTPITVYMRNGRAVDEPDPLLPTLALAVVQAVIVWLVVVLVVRGFRVRPAPPGWEPRR
jgi:hypothetical protein